MHIGSIENILRRKDEEIEKLKDAQKLLYTYSCGEENEYVLIISINFRLERCQGYK